MAPLAPLAALLPGLVDLGVGLVLLAILGTVLGVLTTAAIVLLPIWLMVLALTALGPVTWLAALNVRYRDVRHIVAPLLQALLFLSPVAYSSAALAGTGRWLYGLNPAVGALELGRFVLIGAPWPGPQVFVSIAAALVVAVGGLVYFQHAQRTFADVI